MRYGLVSALRDSHMTLQKTLRWAGSAAHSSTGAVGGSRRFSRQQSVYQSEQRAVNCKRVCGADRAQSAHVQPPDTYFQLVRSSGATAKSSSKSGLSGFRAFAISNPSEASRYYFVFLLHTSWGGDTCLWCK